MITFQDSPFPFALGPCRSHGRLRSRFCLILLITFVSSSLAWARSDGTTAAIDSSLHLAAKSGDFPKLKLLFEAGGKPNGVDESGWTPLHYAAAFGHLAVATYLLDHGADIEALTSNGMSPLHLAAMRGSSILVKLLVKRGSASLAQTNQGQTPLHLAANEAVVSALSPTENTLNFLNSFGLTPLHTARHSSVARKLLDLGADLRIRTPRGQTAMELASVESLENTAGISLHSVMLGRLRGFLSQMPLSLTNISTEKLQSLKIFAESPACSISISPPSVEPLLPTQRTNLTLTLTRDKDIADGDYPIILRFFISDKPIGSIDLRVDTRTYETPEDQGMIRLARGNLRPVASRFHYLAYIVVPLVLVLFGVLSFRKSKKTT